MIKIDPIIAVKDIETSAGWYQAIFGCRRTHGGDEFTVLETMNKEVLLCLHKWGEHDHPTMTSPHDSTGHGLILYFKVDNLKAIRQNVEEMNYPVEEDIHQNPNSQKKEFSIRDPDGYYLTVTEFHNYEG